MKRAIPVLVLSVAGLIPVWRYAPSVGGGSTVAEVAPAPAPTASASASASASQGSGGSAERVVDGATVSTEKGPVQVRVTLDGDRITAVTLLQQPNHPQTTAAVPQLVEETLEAQSADIDTVSGATITSDGYRTSLQAALDAGGV
ncbi:FMN-binding protein [Streptomyces sp. CRN 30]|uniref:FMN-binding protein n=1 Tax=Streptomyces sp. CRN 30 TaxID=3075613 RepID=UPI002A819CBC|nr:FMN-binding protein [Streptomyces sp. CRN 30]